MAERDPRRVQLARIHAGAKALALDEATYRSLLNRITGKTSSKDMTVAERNAVIAELVRLGFKDKYQEGRKAYPGKPNDMTPMLRKVEALLADAKRPWSYAHSTAKQMFKVARVEWLRHDQLHHLVAALQVDAKRRAKAD